MNGYMGKLLFVNLTDGKMWEEDLPEELPRNFIGGYGIGAKILFDRMPADADPLGPENILGFMTGPLTGTGAFFGGRYMAVCKSPVTNGWNDSNSGGYFGPELKKTGFDGVYFMGASEKPVYLWISDSEYELRDASELWGLDAKESWEKLKEMTGDDKVRAAVIGPAGEHLSLFAAVMNDGHRAAGRGGVGAVMGSKNLKAVACRGNKEIPVADRKALMDINRKIAGIIRNPPPQLAGGINGNRAYGTTRNTRPSAMSGDSPVMNWAGSGVADFGQDKADTFDVTVYDHKYNVKPYGCAFCPLRCGAEYKVTDGRWPVGDTERPEYETQAVFGCNCLCDDLEAIIKCNELCNRGGFDTITAGSVVAWVMECYDKGILTKDDIDGIDAKWGSGEAMVALMQKIYDDEGCGKKLKLGQLGAANAYGKGHECLAVANGIEPGLHDARMPGAAGTIRVFQYDPTPGRHVKGGDRPTPVDDPERGRKDIEVMTIREMLNIAGLCSFCGCCFEPTTVQEMLSAVFGREYTRQDEIRDATRVFMTRLSFNIKHGLTRDKMWVSPRLTGRPAISDGPNKDIVLENEKLGDCLFEALGCELDTAKPKKEALEAMGGLETLVEYFYGNK